MHTTPLPIWGLSAFLRRQGKQYLTPIARFQQDSTYVQSPSLRLPCQLGFSERCLAEVLPVLEVELQPVCSVTVTISGGVPELAFVSEVRSRRTSVWTIQEGKFGPGLHKASFGKSLS